MQPGFRFRSRWWEGTQLAYAEVVQMFALGGETLVGVSYVDQFGNYDQAVAWPLADLERGLDAGHYIDWHLPDTDNAWDDGRLGTDERYVAVVPA
jgi:hypothetical protein